MYNRDLDLTFLVGDKLSVKVSIDPINEEKTKYLINDPQVAIPRLKEALRHIARPLAARSNNNNNNNDNNNNHNNGNNQHKSNESESKSNLGT